MPYEELLRRYEESITTLENIVRQTPPDLIDRAPAPGKWSIRQITAHLADSEMVVGARLRWMAGEPGSPLKAWDQDKWAAATSYEQQPLDDSLNVIRALRRLTAGMLRRLPNEAWGRTGMHEERGEITLLQLVELNVSHCEHHAQQINQIRGRLGAAA